MMGGVKCLFVSLFANLALSMVCQQDGYAAVCEAKMYDDPAFAEQRLDFSPYDKIYIIIECDDILAGSHTMHANWIHKQRGLIRSNKHDFVMEQRGKRGIYFWFKLSKKGRSPVPSAIRILMKRTWVSG